MAAVPHLVWNCAMSWQWLQYHTLSGTVQFSWQWLQYHTLSRTVQCRDNGCSTTPCLELCNFHDNGCSTTPCLELCNMTMAAVPHLVWNYAISWQWNCAMSFQWLQYHTLSGAMQYHDNDCSTTPCLELCNVITMAAVPHLVWSYVMSW